jgi:multiple sugar transport system substrate-binding protein
MKKKTSLIFVSALLIVALLVACAPKADVPAGEPAASEQEELVLRVWMEWSDNPAYVQEYFNRYTEQTGIKVEVTAPVDVDKILASLSGSTPPDIIIGASDNIKVWDAEGLIKNLNDVVEEQGIDIEDYFEAPLHACETLQGDLICLPWSSDVYALFWNKDMFEDAGLNPETPPQTLEELVAFADQLTLTDEDGNLTQIGFIPDFSWSHLDLYHAMFGGNGSFYNADLTDLTIADDSMIDAMEWEQQFYSKYGVEQVRSFSSVFGGYDSPDQGFYAGKVAMMVDGEWQVGPNFIQKFKPELNYGVASFPAPEDHPERAGTVVVSTAVAYIPEGVTHAQETSDLLGWIADPDNNAEILLQFYNCPTNAATAANEGFQQDEKFKIFIDLMGGENAMGWRMTPLDAQVGDQVFFIEEQVLFEGAEPAPLLKEAYDELLPSLQEMHE